MHIMFDLFGFHGFPAGRSLRLVVTGRARREGKGWEGVRVGGNDGTRKSSHTHNTHDAVRRVQKCESCQDGMLHHQ